MLALNVSMFLLNLSLTAWLLYRAKRQNRKQAIMRRLEEM